MSIGGFATLAGDRQRLAATARQGLWLLVALVVPLSTIIAVLAQPLLQFVYGPKSSPAVSVLTWIAVLGGVRVLMSFLHDLLVSTGHQRFILAVQLTWLACIAPALAYGVQRDGIGGAAIAHAVVAVCVALPLAVIGLVRVVGPRVSLATLLPVPTAAVCAALVGLAVKEVIDNAPLTLALGGGLMVAVYAGVLTFLGEHRRVASSLVR